MRKFSSLVVIIAFTFVLAALPPTAQAASFQPGKFFSSLKDRVSNGAQRLYLRAVPGPKDGAAVMKQATVAMEKVSSMKMDITADLDVKQGGQSMGTAKVTMNGPMQMTDLYDPSTLREHLSFKGEFKVEGVQVSAAGEVIIDGTDAYYYRLTEIPLPMQQFAQLKNQWIKMDMAAMQGENKPEYSPEFAKRYQDAATKLYKNAMISKARKERWENHPVFVVDAEFDKDSLMTYMVEVTAIAADQTDATQSAMTDKEKAELDKVLTAIAPIKSTLWIDRGTFYLRHLELPLDLNLKEISAGEEMSPTMPEEVGVKLSMTFDEFNEPVTIDTPSDARPIEELMQEMMGGYFMGSPVGMPNTSMPSYPSYGTTRPSYPVQELPELTPEQQMQLKQYGYDY